MLISIVSPKFQMLIRIVSPEFVSPELPAVVTGRMDRQDYPNDVRRGVLANAAVGGGSIAQLARGGQDYDLHFFGAQLIDWSGQIE